MKRVLWLLEAYAVILLSLFFAMLPYKIALKVGEIFGHLLFYLWGSRRRIAIENIEKSEVRSQKPAPACIYRGTALESRYRGSEVRMLAKKNFKNLGKSFVEIIKIYYGFGKRIIDNVEVKGIENYYKARSKNRGTIFITGHCGNWELMAIVFGVKVNNVSSVARAQNNPYLNKLLEKVRTRYGNGVIYKKGALKDMLSELKKNKMIGILMDQSVFKNDGYVIDFLGRPAWTTKMPSLIAKKTGAVVLPIFINRYRGRHVISIYPEVDLSKEKDTEKALFHDTKRFSGFIEDYIRQHPSEWLWIHRRWKKR